MKRPLQLPLAIALALGVSEVMALGLGPVRVHSRLNQPLNAEIPVIQASPGEAEGLLVTLAGAEEFERIGLSRARVGVPLEFKLDKDSSGAMVIKVTSQEPVRQAYLDFLLEANWPKGRLLREYTVLLDPPVTAPARATAATPAPAPSARPASPRQPAPTATATATPRPVPSTATAQVAAGQFGPVEAGQTLSQVARAARPGEDLNRTMLALFKANPDAFYKDNINALKRGAILRVPDAEEIRAIGSAAEAAARVQAQVEDWRGNRAAPTRVADAASPAAGATSASAAADSGERLELVPPKAGQDSLAMADTPGSGSGSARGSAQLREELARTREALTSSEQESTELKSRIKELEDLKGKNDRLISLKDSEIAELQQKLRELQAADGATAPAVAAVSAPQDPATPASGPADAAHATAGSDGSTAPDIAKDDIWGTGGETAPAATPEAAPTEGEAEGSLAQAGDAASAADGAADESAQALAEGAPDPTTETAAESMQEPDAEADAEAVAPAANESELATPAETMPLHDGAPTTGPVADDASPAAVVPPTPSTGPWYMEPWVKPAALGAGVLILLAALFGLRRRKGPPVERKSIAEAFGDSPLAGNGAAEALDPLEAEEADLRQRIAENPHDAGLYLELLSIHYAGRRVEDFEDTAAAMHAIVDDDSRAEWLEAQAMGQELAPHNPLFAAAPVQSEDHAYPGDFEDEAPIADDDPVAEPLADETSTIAADGPLPEEHGLATPPGIGGFEAEEVGQAEPAGTVEGEDEDEDFSFGEFVTPVASEYDSEKPFGELPPLEFGEEVGEVPSAGMAGGELDLESPEAEPQLADVDAVDDDFFSTTGDAVGTKLDLARAYMDMGDPDGARSMLEEVMAEGNSDQQDEARRLMAEMG